jgi:hypothetical protein
VPLPVDCDVILRHPGTMSLRSLINLHRVVLFATVVVALVATGFGHRFQTDQDAALLFALQNGVSLDDICGDLGKATHSGADCQACQITASADLPPLTGTRIDLELAFQAEVVAPREAQALLRPADPAHRPQGPPVA